MDENKRESNASPRDLSVDDSINFNFLLVLIFFYIIIIVRW